MKADKKSVWGVVAAMVVGAVLTVVFSRLVPGGNAAAQRALIPTAEVEARLDRLVASEPMYIALSENFPTEWATMRREMAADIKSTMSVGELNARAHARSRAFVLQQAPATSSAPTAALVNLLAAETDFVAQLQRENTQYCADFGTRGLQPGIQLSPAARQKLGVAGGARILAIRQGLDSPQVRGPMTDEDSSALLDRMEANGTSEATFGAFDNSGGASPEAQCEGTVQLYRAMGQLPPEQSARVFSGIELEAARAATVPAP